jgi:cytoskeletal protein RodZ
MHPRLRKLILLVVGTGTLAVVIGGIYYAGFASKSPVATNAPGTSSQQVLGEREKASSSKVSSQSTSSTSSGSSQSSDASSSSSNSSAGQSNPNPQPASSKSPYDHGTWEEQHGAYEI